MNLCVGIPLKQIVWAVRGEVLALGAKVRGSHFEGPRPRGLGPLISRFRV